MDTTNRFEDLLMWQKAHRFVLDVYRLSQSSPKSETYGLSSQFRRAAVSIAANIAEGYRKRTKLDKLRFYNIAQGSIEESRYYLILTRDLGYGEVTHLQVMLEEISKLLEAYSHSIRLQLKSEKEARKTETSKSQADRQAL